jgi:hypothetical protein
MAENDRVRDLHHRGLQVEREQHAFGLGPLDFGGQKGTKRALAHIGGVDNGACGVA